MEIIIALFVFMLLWLGYGIYLAPSKKEKTQIVRKFFVPAHCKQELVIYWSGVSGVPIEETVVVAQRYYLVITVNGEEDYLWVDKGVWDKTSLRDDVNLEITYLFGFLPYVRKFYMAGSIFS